MPDSGDRVRLGSAPDLDQPSFPRPDDHTSIMQRPQPCRARSAWWTAGPPLVRPFDNRNSFLYVPLLLGAAGKLRAAACADWQWHPVSRDHWDIIIRQLLRAGPTTNDAFLDKLQSLAVNPDVQSPAETAATQATLRRAAALAHSSYSLQALIESMTYDNGYLDAIVQEALLELFGDYPTIQKLTQMADAFRHHAPCYDPAGRNGPAITGDLYQIPDDLQEAELGNMQWTDDGSVDSTTAAALAQTVSIHTIRSRSHIAHTLLPVLPWLALPCHARTVLWT